MINYLKSSISISSYNGCTINCKYCILSSLGNRENVRKVEDEKELVKKLLSLKPAVISEFISNFPNHIPIIALSNP